MQQCPNCGHHNRPGIVFCENCGASLIGKAPIDTRSLDSSTEEGRAQLGIDSSVLTDVKIQGVSFFEEGSMLRLEIEGSPEPILFKPKPETIFGRRDPATGAMPDIDLTPFAGYRMGVSRRHAAIRFGDGKTLDVWDLGSSNGTFLNGERLSAHRPYRLHDGDELRLGQMVIRSYFLPAAPSSGPTEGSEAAQSAGDSAPAAPPTSGVAPAPAPAAPPPAASIPASAVPGTSPLVEESAAPAPAPQAPPAAPIAGAPSPAAPPPAAQVEPPAPAAPPQAPAVPTVEPAGPAAPPAVPAPLEVPPVAPPAVKPAAEKPEPVQIPAAPPKPAVPPAPENKPNDGDQKRD